MRTRLARLVLFAAALHAVCAASDFVIEPLLACSPPEKAVQQPFQLPKLRLQWDSWKTSQLNTAVAAIILSEQLGFDVELIRAGSSPGDVYKNMANGRVHLAFESWPESNAAKFREFVTPVGSNKTDRVSAFPYSDLFGQSGLYEACSRNRFDTEHPQCNDAPILNSPGMLKDVLETEHGQRFFTPDRPHADRSLGNVWKPSRCAESDCSVEILHINEDYDKGLIEGLVERLGLKAKVVYVGEKNLTDVIWSAYNERSGALLYNYFPNINHYGISVLELPRAKISPRDDLKRQQLMKLAWPRLEDARGRDALAFVEVFDMDKAIYAELANLFDLYNDPQRAACVWVKKNPTVWQKWVAFPERENAPLFCLPNGNSNGLCDEAYFRGWIIFFLQLVLCIIFGILATFTNRPVTVYEDLREKLDQKFVPGGIGRKKVRFRDSNFWLYAWVVEGTGNLKKDWKFHQSLRRVPTVLTHVRKYDNFIRPNTDPKLVLPPPSGDDRWICDLNRRTLYTYLFVSTADGMVPVVLFCISLGLFSGALSTFFYQYVLWETFRTDPVAWQQGNPTRQVPLLVPFKVCSHHCSRRPLKNCERSRTDVLTNAGGQHDSER